MAAPYQLGIDLGTTWTAAAICRDGRPEVLPLGGTSSAVASVVFLGADGTTLVGEAAQRRALTEPRRIAREFKRRTGDGTPLLVGDAGVPAEELSARFVAWVVAEAARREGGPAETVAVTHPAEWGEHRRAALAGALAGHGIDPLFLTEPQAAAIGYAGHDRIAPGGTVAVYDLGGGTFDAAVVRRAEDGTVALLGRPVGIDRLGGVDFDDAVLTHVRAALGADWARLDVTDPAVQAAVAGLRRECTAAKEALSADTEVLVPVMLPGLHTQVRLGRAEFEDMIRGPVGETVEALRRAVDSAGIGADALDAVLLVGGSSRIPLVAQLVSAELRRAVVVDADPKAVVASGAALAAYSVGRTDAPPVAAEAPDAPLVAFDAPPVRARRRRGLVLVASLAVAAGLGVSAGVATGVVPLPALPAVTGSPAADPVLAQDAPAGEVPAMALDPWTGAVPVDTTVAGPRRPDAVAAPVRPVARAVRTGAPGASAPARPPVVAPPAGPAAVPPGPGPAAGPALAGPAPGGTGSGGTGSGGTGSGGTGSGGTGSGTEGAGGGTGGGDTGAGTGGGGSDAGGSPGGDTGGGTGDPGTGGGDSGSGGDPGTGDGGDTGGGGTGGGGTGGGTGGGGTGGDPGSEGEPAGGPATPPEPTPAPVVDGPAS